MSQLSFGIVFYCQEYKSFCVFHWFVVFTDEKAKGRSQQKVHTSSAQRVTLPLRLTIIWFQDPRMVTKSHEAYPASGSVDPVDIASENYIFR